MPKVSVIIPVFNRSRYLEKCLDSVLNQTLSDIEVICVDDGSTDDSLRKLQNYALKDKRVKVISLGKNRGVSAARNIGIENAKGEFLAFVDSDDFVDRQFYEKLYNKALETQADCAKGNIYNYDEKTGEISLTEFYDMNEKISQNKYYFYYGFTSGIYKTDIVKKNNIKFPENKSYFEDPYFSIQVAHVINKVSTVDDAKYYYLKHAETLSDTINVEDMYSVIREVLSYLDANIQDKTDYEIIFDFLFNHVVHFYKNLPFDPHAQSILLDTIVYCMVWCKYDLKACRQICKDIMYRIDGTEYSPQLLAHYKKYDKLNSNPSTPLIKILVSYIKPSFLFKSSILTPIHLGRVVEEEKSKDGIQSAQALKWLHENCIGDDDFEGNISALNRRVGFLTGTYWAWKNYEKLGNPVYFGSFGYRRVFMPYCLEDLCDYDLILPRRLHFHSLREQLADTHGEIYYKNMMAAMKAVYPDELNSLNQYMAGDTGYFCESYIMKKKYFFEFCEWIFKLLFYMLENCCFKMENLHPVGGVTNPAILKIIHRTTERRDVAFVIERFTGYYLYRLTKNPAIRYKEVDVFESSRKNSLVFIDQVRWIMLASKLKNAQR